MNSVGTVDDIEAIKQLKARYFRMMDTKRWDEFAQVFTEDVVIDMTAEGGAVTNGRDAFVEFLRPTLESVTTVHHGHMPEIVLQDADSASGTWAMEDHLWWPEGSPIKRLHGYGHYHETYRRTADGWRIATMSLTRLRRDFEFA
ncbi:MAG: hypothetical protein JWN62_649 [Acidimicrobiales bacterium]|nr:hypothetical protein [Acidimicrobiales bacterium]